MKLWDFQEDVVEHCRRAIAGGFRRILIVAPTGAGKTVIGSHILHAAEQKGRSSVFFAHRRELIEQTAKKLDKFGVEHGVIMAGEPPCGWAGTQIASIDTLRARYLNPKRTRKFDGLWKRPAPAADIIMVDEAHRARSPTYTAVLDHYYENTNAVSIGLTATPIRGDGKGLGRHYDYMVQAPSIEELMKRGYLVVPKYYAPTIPDLTGVKVARGDYVEKELQNIMDKREPVGDIVSNYLRIAPTRRAIVFASGVRHSIHITERFQQAGVRAEHVDGETSLDDRRAILDRLRSGETQVISNCMVLTEGFDCPELDCCILARPTRNVGLYLQMAGRVLRSAAGKKDAVIIDHSGNIYEHGFVEDDHGWQLTEGKPSKEREERQKEFDKKDPITCVECGHVYTGQRRCPACGHEPVKRGEYVETKHADLIEVRRKKWTKEDLDKSRHYSKREKQQWFSMFLRYAQDKGHKEGSAAYKFKDKFGEWPKDMQRVPAEEITPECQAFITYLNIRNAKGRKRKAA